MKKIILMLACAIGCTAAFAQDDAMDAKIGIKGGLNFSNYYIDQVTDQDMRVGFHIGVFTKLPVNDRVSLAPEILFSQKGAKLYYDNAFGKGSADFTFNYIDVPLLLRVDLIAGLNLQLGPYISFLVNSTVKDVDENGQVKLEDEMDKSDFNTFDWGLTGGVGLEIGAINLGARYNYGLTIVGKDKQFLGQTYRFPDGKNSVTQLYVGFAF